MTKLNKLKTLSNKIKYMVSLGALGLCLMNNNINVNAESNYSIESDEIEETTTSNEGFEPKTMDEYIEYHSKVFGINKELIYDRLDYMFNENTDNKEFLEMNTELKVITVVRDIKDNPKIDSSIKYTNQDYEVTLEPEELIEKYAPVIGTNKYISLSIAFSECVNPIRDDWNYNTNGNLAGIGTDNYLGNKEEGVIETLFIFRDEYDIKEDTNSDIFASISQRYCPPNWQVWQERANDFYNGLINYGYYSNSPEDIQNKHKEDSKGLTYKKRD